jgi:hypothetical protein
MGRPMGCREGLLLGADRLGRFCLQTDSSVTPRSRLIAHRSPLTAHRQQNPSNLPSNQCPYAKSRTSTTGVSPNASLNA